MELAWPWLGRGFAWDLQLLCLGCAWAVRWLCVGFAFDSRWLCIGFALALNLLCICFALALHLLCICFAFALNLLCICFALDWYWIASGWHWNGVGFALDSYRSRIDVACDDWHARGGRNAGEPWLRNAGAVLACDDWHAGVAAMLASHGCAMLAQ